MTWKTAKERAMQTLGLPSTPPEKRQFWRNQVQRLDQMAADAESLGIKDWQRMKLWDLRAEIWWRRNPEAKKAAT